MGCVALFDIDGTLISTGGAGRRAIRAGLRQVVGRPVNPEFSFAGMTDRAIMRRALEQAGETVDDRRIDAAIDAYLSVLQEEVQRAEDYRVFPGVESLLEGLVVRDEVALGLGTGNARRGATIKLSRAGLNRYFEFGGFGCEWECRRELIRSGIERGASRLGVSAGQCRTVVIGDTPADVDAGRSNGADVLAVSTGSVSAKRLRECQPDWLVSSLADRTARAVFEQGG